MRATVFGVARVVRGGRRREPLRACVNGNRKPHICGNRKLHTSGEDVSAGADILPVMPVGRVGLDAGSGATGVLANTRREAAEPAVTWRLPHAVRPTLSSAGIVKLTLRPAQCRDEHSPAPLPSASLSARNHQPCRLALPQILHELPGC